MAQTLFEHPLELGDAWENASTYTFFLKTGDEKGAAAAPAPPVGAPLFLHGTPAPGGTTFRPNLVVTREAQGDRDLARYAEEQRQAMQNKLPAARLAKESKGKLAGCEAIEREYAIALDRPYPALSQWHASLLRDGHFYTFCGTSTKERFERDRKAFRALVESWKRT